VLRRIFSNLLARHLNGGLVSGLMFQQESIMVYLSKNSIRILLSSYNWYCTGSQNILEVCPSCIQIEEVVEDDDSSQQGRETCQG